MSFPRNTRGEISVESVIYFPALLLIVLCGFHLAALLHTTHIGALAATRGAHQASSQFEAFGNISMARDEVNKVTTELGGVVYQQPTVSVTQSSITVSVFMQAPRIVPFLPYVVTRSATSAREMFRQEGER